MRTQTYPSGFVDCLTYKYKYGIRLISEFPRAYALNPSDVAQHGGQVFVPIFRDQDDIFNPHTAYSFVPLEYIEVDMLRIAHGRDEVR